MTALGRDVPLPAAAYPLVLFDDAEQAGALGYHAETPDGRPYGRVFVGPSRTRLLLDATPIVARGTPAGFIESFTSPAANVGTANSMPK